MVRSVLSPAGAPASSIHQLWLLLLRHDQHCVCDRHRVRCGGGSFAVCVAVHPEKHNDIRANADAESVGSPWRLTVVTLICCSSRASGAAAAVASIQASSVVSVEITGHQWWWEIEYEDAVPSRRVVTANELHIPMNRPVVLKVTSRDVIHSFWVPNLQGKRDLIPGYTTAMWLQAESSGRLPRPVRGVLRHAARAHGPRVVAESDEDFRGLARRDASAGARSAASRSSRAGRDVFMQARCAGCHADPRHATPPDRSLPDLTHIATRSTLGAGTLANTPEHLAAWIRDPQRVKPGNQMPPNPLAADESRRWWPTWKHSDDAATDDPASRRTIASSWSRPGPIRRASRAGSRTSITSRSAGAIWSRHSRSFCSAACSRP